VPFSRLRNAIKLFTLLILLLPATVRAESTPTPALPSYNWAVKASPNLATHPPPVEAVRDFMEQTSGSSGVPVCSFRFADLRHEENLTLLLTLWDGGHGGCGSLYIVDRTPTGFQTHLGWCNLNGIDDVNQVLRDINRDGKFEVIIDSEFTDYEGGNHCLATWPVIYGWDGKNYANLSGQPQSRRFYEQEIRRLRQGTPDDCEEATIAKIRRFLGAPPNTGMTEAIAWATSGNRFQREFAVGVLSDIGTPEAKKYLRILTRDRFVAMEAKRAFAYRHFGKPEPEPAFLEVDDSNAQDQSATDDKYQLAQSAARGV
jgi:hypothetical protein